MSVGSDTASGAASGASTGAVLGPWGALAGGIIGGAISYFGASSKHKENLRLRQENDRRRALELQTKVGEATAMMNASGVEGDTGSATQYLAIYTAELRRQAEWASKAEKMQADAGKTVAALNLSYDVGKAVYGFARQNNFWSEG